MILTWEDTNLDDIVDAFYSYGWDNALGSDEWVNDDGVWKVQDRQLEDGSFWSYSHHCRLWALSNGDIVANTHYQTVITHEIQCYEGSEYHVADEFDPDWNVFEDSVDMGNECTKPAYNDGLLTVISRVLISLKLHEIYWRDDDSAHTEMDG